MQTKPEYETLEDYSDLASKLVNKYPEVFGQLEIDKVKCVAITNKDRSEKRNLWEVKAVTYPIRMDCPYAYYIIIHMSDWIEMDEAHQAALVAASLHAIPVEDGKEGNVIKPELKNYGNMLRTLGVDYMENAKIPNLIKDDVEWKTSR